MFNLYRPPQHRASYSYTAGSGAGYTGYTAPERNSRITPERERPPGSRRLPGLGYGTPPGPQDHNHAKCPARAVTHL